MSRGERIPLAVAAQLAVAVAAHLAPFCERIEVAGSVRRGVAGAPDVVDVGDVELVVVPKTRAEQVDLFGAEVGPRLDCLMEELDRLVRTGDVQKGVRDNGRTSWGTRNRLVLWPAGRTYGQAFLVDLWWALDATFGWQMVQRTGPAHWAHWLVTRRAAGGPLPNNCELKDGALWRYEGQHRRFVPTPDEATLFREIGMAFVPVAERRMLAPSGGGSRGIEG